MTCSFKDCSRPVEALGLCNSHYSQNYRGRQLKPLRSYRGETTKSGYKMRRVNGRRVYEHRLVMEEYLGRELLPDENVHHLNGNRSDNRIENLELWSKSQPAGQRVEDKLQWAREFIARYTPEGSFDEEELW